MEIHLKRVYAAAAPGDGKRVLADRLWPRGISKDRAGIDLWAKEVTPSTELRQWYAHDPEKFAEFERRYRAELETEPARSALVELAQAVDGGPVTLVTSAKDVDLSHLLVLAAVLDERFRSVRGGA